MMELAATYDDIEKERDNAALRLSSAAAITHASLPGHAMQSGAPSWIAASAIRPPRKDVASSMGFTLIELSIVLVIIGLIIGGVLVGQDLIQAAKQRAQISQLEEYETAVNIFKLKYNGLPGDLTNPEVFWAGMTKSTNGRPYLGDGRLRTRTYDVGRTDRQTLDVFWQLGSAGLVAGEFDGTFSGNGVPPSKLDDTIRVIPAGQCCGVTSSQLTTAESDLTYRFAFYLSYVNFAGGGQGILSGSDAGVPVRVVRDIDVKLDDGIARQGKIKAYRLRSSGPCLDANDGDYDMASNAETKGCTLEWIMMR